MKKTISIQPLTTPWQTEDPFLFCMHHKDAYPAGNDRQGPAVSLAGRNLGQDFSGRDGFSMYHGKDVPGFPVHPHRGFETVTLVLKGYVDHFDSKGSEGRYGAGDVQWMTAGSGCQHAEMFPLTKTDEPNPLELFQIWLNLPASTKMTQPDYKMLWAEDVPVARVSSENGSFTDLRIISGIFEGIKACEPPKASYAYYHENKVGIALLEMSPNATYTLTARSGTLLRNLYFYQGEGKINVEEDEIPVSRKIKLTGGVDVTIKNGAFPSSLLLLEGEPIGEPVAHYGPFVMNTQEELEQAFRDYRATEFGGWPWKSDAPVHKRTQDRFARHMDGRVEKKD